MAAGEMGLESKRWKELSSECVCGEEGKDGAREGGSQKWGGGGGMNRWVRWSGIDEKGEKNRD